MSSVTGSFKFHFSLDAQKKMSIDRYLFIHTKKTSIFNAGNTSVFKKVKAKHRTKINLSILRHRELLKGNSKK